MDAFANPSDLFHIPLLVNAICLPRLAQKILSRSHSNYLAQISIEMTEANNRANDVLSKLTALGTVIVPLNVITGLWGMNVNVPGQGVENLNWFAGLVCSMVVIAVGGYILAIRYLQR